MTRLSRVEWTLVSGALLAAAIYANSFHTLAGTIAAGLIGFAGGWVLATRVLP